MKVKIRNVFSVITSCTFFESPRSYHVWYNKVNVNFFIPQKKRKNTFYGWLVNCCQSKLFLTDSSKGVDTH